MRLMKKKILSFAAALKQRETSALSNNGASLKTSKATVRTSTEEKEYIGSTGRSFRQRFSEHKHALKHRSSQQSTTLSKFVWTARDKGEDPKISWSLVHSIPTPRGPQRICSTCNLERMEIAAADQRRSLNKRSELTGKCVHFRSSYF